MFSKSCQYAIRAIMYLAIHASPEEKMGVDEMADKLNVPKHFLAKILQQLSRTKLISSTKGPNGGFYLNLENRKNKMIDLVKVMEGAQFFEQCILGLAECSSVNPCPLHNGIKNYRAGLIHILEKETIDEFSKRIEKKLDSITL